MHPLVEEAMKKAAVAWLAVGHRPPYAVWCLWIDGVLYVVSGPGEQSAPDLAEAPAAVVTARGDHGGRIVSWPASVRRLDPGTDEWATVTPQLAGKRLNLAAETAADTTARWAAECVVSALTPADDEAETGPALPDGSLAAPPLPSPAARPARKPFRLHRVRKPR